MNKRVSHTMAEKIYINLCSAQQLQGSIEGIGKVRAELLVKMRTEVGRLSLAVLWDIYIYIF